MDHYLEQVVDLIDPSLNRIFNMTVGEAAERVLSGNAEAVREIDGSFALIGRSGKRVRLARSLDRPMRYFLAKRHDGPALVVADRIDAIHEWLKAQGLGGQFHPSYTRMVPAHHVVEIQLVGCPDPDPVYTRFFDPQRNPDLIGTDLDEIGKRYIGALADEIARWLRHVPEREPIGVCFSGGIDSGAVFLTTYHALKKLGLNPARLKAFTLTFKPESEQKIAKSADLGGRSSTSAAARVEPRPPRSLCSKTGEGPDLAQARAFLEPLGLGLFLEAIEADLADIDVSETIRVVEDYKPLDIECASMGLTLAKGIRARYPEWRYLLDGDGGDENLKDYPIEENPELTIRSVVHNQMLYQEGWGVGRIKHSLTYSGGLSRSYARTYAPLRHFGFEGFSPFTRPNVIEVAEGIPFIALTDYKVDRLYALKGEIVRRGVKAITGLEMPVFEKRRFQHGALRVDDLRTRVPNREADLRKLFLSLYQ